MIARIIKAAARRALSSRWGWRTVGSLVRAPGVVVLTYHRVLDGEQSHISIPRERFASQMRWIRDHCDPIHPDDLQHRARLDGRRQRPAVLVTFDDGYRDYHDHAYPVLREHKIPALVFLATSFMGTVSMPWTEELQWAVLHSRRDRALLPGVAVAPVPLGDRASRTALGERTRAYLKSLPDADRRAALACVVRELDATPAQARPMLTWDEVRRTMDVTTYGGHSHTHPILSRLTRGECEREIRACRACIASETGREPRFFAYPNGEPRDFTAETQELLRGNGFDVAFTMSHGVAGADTDWLAVKRISAQRATPAELAWLMAARSAG